MDEELVKIVVENEYGINISSIEKIKNVYKIITESNNYCLKIIKYEYKHFLFILSAIKHLQNNGFDRVPEIIKTFKGSEYIALDNKYGYLTEWVNARECNYDNPLDVISASSKLAELHKKSIGFKTTEDMKPRVGWLRWIKNFRTRQNEVLDFKKRILEKDIKTEFDYTYLNAMEEELNRIDRSIDNLIKSEYFEKMILEKNYNGFCHHDCAHHNILIEEDGRINFIDFDYCILDSHLHDLASLIIRIMKNGKWNIENVFLILDSYNDGFKVESNDIPIIAGFMEFPQAYWQVGIQYYWEKQPWEEEFFLKKLRRILDDREDRQEFINEFKNLKYK